MLERLTKITSIVFSLLWTVVIFVEYWHYNLYYEKAFQNFQYANLFVIFLLIGVTISWGLTQAKRKKWSLRWVNGLSIFLLLLLLDSLTITAFYSKMSGIHLSAKGLFLHLGHLVGVVVCVYLVALVCRIVGYVFTTIFPPQITSQDMPIIEVALGIMFVTFALFFLGIFHLLNVFAIAPLFAFILFFNWRKTRQVVYETLFQPIRISNRFNALGAFSFLFLALFLVFDFTQLLRPFPLGTDSINLYVNLPSLIAQYGSLVDGNQPYNWSLFMSLGLVLFGRVDVVLALSFLGSFLSLVALYRLSRKWLDVNHAAFCLLLYFSVPMVNFLSHMDMKIDMGLLYITLCILLLLVNWFSSPITSKQSLSNSSKNNKRQTSKFGHTTTSDFILKIKTFFSNHLPPAIIENRLIALIGVFAGFAFGIKLTALFLFFALITTIWYAKGGLGAFLGSFFLVMAVIFLLQLDEQSHLRAFHQNVALLQWTLLLMGLGILAYMALKRKKLFIRLIQISTILGLFFLLPVLPWLGKNFVETQTISVEALLNGKQATPRLNFNELESKWEEVYKK